MKKTLTTIRCVPRYGFDYTEVRSIDIGLTDVDDAQELADAIRRWFAAIGIADALYAIEVDDNGYFAIINDEAYHQDWGVPLL